MTPQHGHDERINLRPYLLTGIFAWGVACGFLFHALQKAPDTGIIPDEPPKTTTATPTPPAATVETAPPVPQREVRVEPPPPVPPDSANAGETSSLTQPLDALAFPDATPPAPPLALDVKMGLTGRTAMPPPAMSATSTTPSREEAVPVSRRWSAWDDPDMIFQ